MTSQALSWWLIVQGIGLIGLPITLLVFRGLPGAGYAFSKPVGILLGAYLFWLALSLHLLPNRPGSIVWVFLLLTAVDVYLIRRYGAELRALLEPRLALVVAVEIVFAAAFAIAVYLRSFIPEIGGTEKPMDFMFLNAASRSRYYTPDDAWLSGFGVSYYYFGYVIQAMIAKLAVVPTSVAFNLGLASTAALAATAAFGLAYELVRLARATVRAAIVTGCFAVVLVLVVGNLEAVAEFALANGYGRDALVSLLDIANLDQARESTACVISALGGCVEYPNDESSFWWWWRATRISPAGNTITEFPFFSFLLGDLHPHVMAIPFVLTVVALGLVFWRFESRLDFAFWRAHPALLLMSAILLGSLGFLNTWDLPTFGFVIVLLVFAHALRDGAVGGPGYRISRAFEAAAGFMLPLLALALLLYAPFYLSFSSQASGLEAVSDGATRPLHSALFWTPLLAVSLPLPLLLLSRDRGARTANRVLRALVLPSALLLFWAFVVITKDGPGELFDAVAARGANWLTAGFFAAALVVTLLALWRMLEGPRATGALVERLDLEADGGVLQHPGLDGQGMTHASRANEFLAPVLVLIATGLLLVYGAELFFVRDIFGSRLNSVFKLYYQAWLLLGVAGAASTYWIISASRPLASAARARPTAAAEPVAVSAVYAGVSSTATTDAPGLSPGYDGSGSGHDVRPPGPVDGVDGARRAPASRPRLMFRVWLAVTAVILAGALLYPLGATLSRTNGLSATARTLDGLAFARRDQRDDFLALRWLHDRAGPDATIIEATGGQYSGFGRVSAWTGVPAVIGWAGHELQWGRDGRLLGERQTEVDKAYSSASLAEALPILRKYGVTYVFVGSLERGKYPPAGLQKFEESLPAAFRSGDTAVYRVPVDLNPASAAN